MFRFFAALTALFALYSIRAWFVLGGAFFGILFVRVGVEQMRSGDDWPMGALVAAVGLWLLRISYKWFAVRWRGQDSNSERNTPTDP